MSVFVGNRTTVRLSKGYSLSDHVNAVATVWGAQVLFLVQQRGLPVAAVWWPPLASLAGSKSRILIVLFAFFCVILFFFLVGLAFRELSS